MSAKKATIDQLGDFISRIHDINCKNQKKGITPKAINVLGVHGLGKSSVVKQVAETKGIAYFILEAAALTEPGDITGLPVAQYEIYRGDESKWVSKEAVEVMIHDGWSVTGNVTTKFATNNGLAQLPENGILCIDDYTRANPLLLQALMSLTLEQKFGDFNLPKGWTVVATSNPGDGEYIVNQVDAAQMDRFITVEAISDSKVWARWAEGAGLSDMAINFVLKHPELLNDTSYKVSPRGMTNFLYTVGEISTTADGADALFLHMVGDGLVGPDVVTHLIAFCTQGLDKLMGIEEIFTKPMDEVVSHMKSVANLGKQNVRHDIMSIFATRTANYFSNLPKEEEKKKAMRILDLLREPNLFSKDLKCSIVMSVFHHQAPCKGIFTSVADELRQWTVER